jgi:hypothetical protein
MIKKLSTFLCIFFMYQITLAQSNRVLINGIVINPSSNAIKNSHIINLTTNSGTISNTNGTYTIRAKKGDWLQITNIQFHPKNIRITQNIYKEQFLRIYLSPVLNQLDEVKLKKK